MQHKRTKLDVRDLFRRLDRESYVCLLTSATPAGWKTVLGFNPAETFSYKAGQRSRLRSFLARSARKGRPVIGCISYDLGYELHGIRQTARDDLQLPDIYFHAFDNYVEFGPSLATLHFADPGYPGLIAEISARPIRRIPPCRSTNFQPVITPARYDRSYRAIRNYLYEGDMYQINFTHRLEARSELPARELFRRVMQHNPVDFLAYIEGDGFEVLSASPERFVKIAGRRIETCPIKGTRPRGRTAASDRRYRESLLESAKEAAELNMITDLLRNDLGKVCTVGSVKVRGSRLVSACPTVWHTYSRITGTVAERCAPVDALLSMLPGGSITGCPKRRAMEIIDELEPVTRSVYTGVIGCIRPNSDLDFSIAIRTIIKKARSLYLQVGGGIVYDSQRKSEFKETFDKARSFLGLLR